MTCMWVWLDDDWKYMDVYSKSEGRQLIPVMSYILGGVLAIPEDAPRLKNFLNETKRPPFLVSKEVWEQRHDSVSVTTEDPCDTWDPGRCFCKGACSCHFRR